MTSLSWLHLTDWHVGQKDGGLWNASTKKALHEDLERVTRAVGPWDVVLFTGDVAYSGKKTEYEQADRELAELWAIFEKAHAGKAAPVLLCVPGNHDLARPGENGRGDAAASGLLNDSNVRERLWQGQGKDIETIAAWFADYSVRRLQRVAGTCSHAGV